MTQHSMAALANLPLAQREAWESLGSRFSGDHAKFDTGDLWALGGVILAGIALVWFLRWMYHLQQARRQSCEPRHLFVDLCRAHRLRRSDRKRLALLAEYHDLPLAPVIFVRPDLFAAAQIPDGGELQLAAYERLKNKLFAGLERDVAATSAASQISAAAAGPVVAPSVVASSVEITSDASTSTPVQ